MSLQTPRYSQAQMRAMSELVAAAERKHPDMSPRLSAIYADIKKAQIEHKQSEKKAREMFTGRKEEPKPVKKIKSRHTVIPKPTRKILDSDPFMDACIYTWFDKNHVCQGHIEWEHPFKFAGKKVQERWSVVPLCWGYHQGSFLNKDINRLVSFLRMTPDEYAEAKAKYPTLGQSGSIDQEITYLKKKYPHISRAYARIAKF